MGVTPAMLRYYKSSYLLFLLLAVALALRHLHLYFSETNILHLEPLADSFLRITLDQGWMSTGQELGESRVTFGGPLYTWLSYPSLLLSRNPVTGLHLCYYLLELAGLAVWMLWPSGGKLPREVRWLGGVMLVLYPEAKVELCENSTIMAYLLPSVAMTFLWSLRDKAWKSMLLPGVLLGAAVQVHAMAAVLAPALLIAVIHGRQLMVRRILALCVGGLLAGTISLSAESYSAQQGGDVLSYLWSHFSSPRMALGLLHLVKDPLVLVGVALLVAAWRRGERLSSAKVLALSWLVFGVLGASIIYAREVAIFFPFMPRFALINAGRVILAGAGALWLLGALNRRLEPRFGKTVSPMAAAYVALALGVVYMAPGLLRGAGSMDEAYLRVSNGPCLCELLDSHNLSRFRKRSFDDLLDLPAQLNAPVKVEPYDRWGRELSTAQIWQPAAGGAWPPGFPAVGTVVAAPNSRALDLSRVPGARRLGNLFAIPGCVPADPAALTNEGRLLLTGGATRRPGDRLLLLLFSRRQDRSFSVRMRATTPAGPRTVTPKELCHCRGGHSFVGGWYLFDMKGLPADPAAFRLEVEGRPGDDWKAQAHFLPTR